VPSQMPPAPQGMPPIPNGIQQPQMPPQGMPSQMPPRR
jgi:hypothetical protein